MGDAVTLKGNKDGVVLLLDCSVEFETLCRQVLQKLWQSKGFLGEHTALTVHSGDVCLSEGQRLALRVLLQLVGCEVRCFLPEAAHDREPVPEARSATAAAAPADADRERLSGAPAVACLEQADLRGAEQYPADGALVVRKNVRSGQKLSCDGTLIVLGDVNAGAELVATGHIVVLGTLRGVAHAGCRGNADAVIYAASLCSPQLRIAEWIARAPDGEREARRVPELARIIDGRLVIEEV